MAWASKEPDRLTTLLAICAAFATLAGGGGLLNLVLKDPPPEMPAGTPVVSGLVLDWDASADGRVVAAEIRGAHRQMGDTREHLALVRADGSEENLGYGATLPAVSPDGRWIAWLASRERGDRTGPGRVRAAAGGAAVSTPAAMPPFVFGPDSVAFFTGYDATRGLGTLSQLPYGDRFAHVIADSVPAGRFASDGSAGTLVFHERPDGRCELRRLARGAAAMLAPDVNCDSFLDPARLAPPLPELARTPSWIAAEDGHVRVESAAAPGTRWLRRVVNGPGLDQAYLVGSAATPDAIVLHARDILRMADLRDLAFAPDGLRVAMIKRDATGRESVRVAALAGSEDRELAHDAEHAEIRWASDGSLLYVWSRPTDWTDPRNGIYRVAPP